MERAITDYGTCAEVKVEHWRETEIDTVHAQFPRKQVTQSLCFDGRARDILVPGLAQGTHRGNGRESLSETLHASTFVIHTDQQRGRAQRANRRGQRLELRAGFKIARKENHAAGERMHQSNLIGRSERGPLDAEDHGSALK